MKFQTPYRTNYILKKNQRMLDSVRRKNKQNSDPHWEKEKQIFNKLSNLLKVDAEANSLLKEQIVKESYADNAVQQSINEKILDLKNEAMGLAKILEKEKRKNVSSPQNQIQLQAIIKHVKFTMDEEKKIEATHRDDINFQNLSNLTRKIKKKEYDLDQIYSKSNELNSKNKRKKNEVDAYRTQRVIDSSIFLKIEHELVTSEMRFKKLLIDKIKTEKQYQKSLSNYIKIKNDIGKQQTKVNSLEKQDTPQDQFFTNAPEIKNAMKFTDIQGKQGKKRASSIPSKKVNSVHEAKKQKNCEEEFAVKKLFIETGLNSSSSLIDHLENIEEINLNLFQDMNDKAERVNELLQKINQIQKIRAKKKISYYRGEPKLTKAQIQYKNSQSLLKIIDQIKRETNTESQRFQFLLMSEELKNFQSILQCSEDKQKIERNAGKIQDFFQKIQKNISPILTWYHSVRQEEDGQRTQEIKDESLDDVIGKVKKIQESEKVMSRKDFQNQYNKLKSSRPLRQLRKKSTLMKK